MLICRLKNEANRYVFFDMVACKVNLFICSVNPKKVLSLMILYFIFFFEKTSFWLINKIQIVLYDDFVDFYYLIASIKLSNISISSVVQCMSLSGWINVIPLFRITLFWKLRFQKYGERLWISKKSVFCLINNWQNIMWKIIRQKVSCKRRIHWVFQINLSLAKSSLFLYI